MQTENRLVVTVREGKRDELKEQCWNIPLYITMCKIDSQWEFAARWRDLKAGAQWQPRGVGWGGKWEVGGRFKREGIYVYLWLIHVDVWQKLTQYCKAIILQLKIINLFTIRRKKLTWVRPVLTGVCVFPWESLSAGEDWPGKLAFPGYLQVSLTNAADSHWRLLSTYYVPGMVLSVLCVLTLLLWPPDAKSWLIWKDPDAGKDWGQEEKGMTEDEMVGWHHQLSGHEFE